MRPFTSTISFERALEIMLAAARPIDRTEVVPLSESDGRVAVEDVSAPFDVPPFDRAAMDGYAVLANDTRTSSADNPVALKFLGRALTGEVSQISVGTGTCVEIATGAPVPPGADAVVMVEETSRHGDVVHVKAPVRAGQNIGRRGSDLARGDSAIAAGEPLNPSRMGALAAAGVDRLSVYARPVVAIISTGNEVAEPGVPLAPGQIYDVNRITVGTVVRRHGGVSKPYSIAGDTTEALLQVLDEATVHDIVVFSGGSSVGERDLVRDALVMRGEMHFHGIAVKPGKPTGFATVRHTPVFAMPGNPTSCLSNAYMLLVPFLRRMARLPPWQPNIVRAPLARAIKSTTGRLQFYTVRVIDGRVEPAFKASGDITSMAKADGYIEIPANVDVVEEGSEVVVKLF